MKINLRNECETIKLGEQIAEAVKPGMTIAMVGDLGAGKTTMSRAIIQALGVDEPVTSPTFTIVNEYEGNLPIYHFDVYRLSDVSELQEIGYEEYINGNGVCIIEWANLIAEELPLDSVIVTLKYSEDTLTRDCYVEGLDIKE